MKRLLIEQSNDEFYTSHSGLAPVGMVSDGHNFTEISMNETPMSP